MSIPDNRIRFPAAKLDFADLVGESGQDHDNYPPPRGQARFDHLRIYLIGLLTQQAAFDAPTQFRDGTAWFDLNTLSLKIRIGSAWVSYAQAIALTEPDADNNITTLADFYSSTQQVLSSISPDVTFSGQVVIDGTTEITIPTEFQASIDPSATIFLHINGSLVDPSVCTLLGNPPTTIRLSGISLQDSDIYIVTIKGFNGASGSAIVGPQGEEGPNLISSSTETNLNGILIGTGSLVGAINNTPLTPIQISADQDNYDPGVSLFYRLSSDASRAITGLSISQTDGQTCNFINVGTQNIVLKHQTTSSTENRFLNSTGADITLAANEMAFLVYDDTTERWRVAKL